MTQIGAYSDLSTVEATLSLGRLLSHPYRIIMLGRLAAEGQTLEQLQRTLRTTRRQALHHLRRLSDQNLLDQVNAERCGVDVEPTFTLKPGVKALVLSLPVYAQATRERGQR